MRLGRGGALAVASATVFAVVLIACTAPPPADLYRAVRDVPDASGGPATTAPPVTPGRGAAPGSGPLGLKWNRALTATLDFVQRSRSGWTFYEVEWCDVEPTPGDYDWAMVDQFVREARGLGQEPMLKLRTGQCWATEPPIDERRDTTENLSKAPSTPATDLPAYLDFVRAAVRRYSARGIVDYAVENEPDTINHWAGTVSEYRKLVVVVAREIRQASPSAHVLDGGASSTSYGVAMAASQLRRQPRLALRTYRHYYARRIDGDASRWPAVKGVAELRQVLASPQARRAVRAVDAGVRLANSGAVDAYQLHYYEPTSRLPSVLRYLDRRLRDRVPVEAWEIGVAWPGAGYDERLQADEVYRLVALLLRADIRRVVYLPVAFTPAPGKVEVFRGLTTPDGTVLPAGGGWQELAASLAGLRGAAIHDARGRLRGVTWSVGRQQAALVWARGGPVRLDPTDVERVVDATGSVVTGSPVVGRQPVLVTGSPRGELARQIRLGRY
ncbi:hypothetical protein [Nocardioides sp. SR21]|uniref:hypothetical protein n=1 Tax=Nocardioides sp. SR21 TaxID=2919501 RepID=UPI001FA9BA28|nr:hypothetical protein [Nocardioides sp. SR21]